MSLLLLLFVPPGTGAEPHIEHLPAQHPAVIVLQGEDHLGWPPVDAPDIRAETHELDLLTDQLRAGGRGDDREGHGESVGGGVLEVLDVLAHHPDEMVSEAEVLVGGVGVAGMVGAALHWFVDVVRIGEHREGSDRKTGGGRSANMELHLDRLVHVNVELAQKVAEVPVPVLRALIKLGERCVKVVGTGIVFKGLDGAGGHGQAN